MERNIDYNNVKKGERRQLTRKYINKRRDGNSLYRRGQVIA
jgi:hypothetical protein